MQTENMGCILSAWADKEGTFLNKQKHLYKNK